MHPLNYPLFFNYSTIVGDMVHTVIWLVGCDDTFAVIAGDNKTSIMSLFVP